MKQAIPIWKPSEYHWLAAEHFIPLLVPYLHDDDEPRPAIIVVPGGSYCFVSPWEAEPIADVFFEKGYNTFVLIYTTNPCFRGSLGYQPLNDLARAVRLVRRYAEQWRIIPDQVAVCGFSAGGHLACSLAVHWNASFILPDPNGDSCRPDAVLLSYPVVTMGQYTHADSRRALLGSVFSPGQMREMSLEENVQSDTPPVFFWHTRDDEAVPVQNSLLLQKALLQNGVVHEMHLFMQGAHGAALSNERWKRNDNGTLDTEIQYRADGRYALEHRDVSEIYPQMDLSLYSNEAEWLEACRVRRQINIEARRTDAGIALWPELAHCFLQRVWNSKSC